MPRVHPSTPDTEARACAPHRRHWAGVLLAVAVSGCAGVPPRPPLVVDAAGLAARIDRPVRVAGARAGPAKLGDFVVVDGEAVHYDPAVTGDAPYGARVVVDGLLRHVGATGADCGEGCVQAAVPSHWYLEDARRVRDDGGP
jgi:hypothetical protein